MNDATDLSDQRTLIPSETPPPDTTGGGATESEEQRLARIQRESDATLQQHNAETPKRGNGKRGPDKVKRKPKVSLGSVDDGASPAPFVEDESPANSAGWMDPEKPFDEAAAKAAFELALDGLEFLGTVALSLYGDRKVGDDSVVKRHVDNAKPSETARKRFVNGWTAVAKKHGWRVDQACYLEAGIGSIMVLGGYGAQFKNLKSAAEVVAQPKLNVVQ